MALDATASEMPRDLGSGQLDQPYAADLLEPHEPDRPAVRLLVSAYRAGERGRGQIGGQLGRQARPGRDLADTGDPAAVAPPQRPRDPRPPPPAHGDGLPPPEARGAPRRPP